MDFISVACAVKLCTFSERTWVPMFAYEICKNATSDRKLGIAIYLHEQHKLFVANRNSPDIRMLSCVSRRRKANIECR